MRQFVVLSTRPGNRGGTPGVVFTTTLRVLTGGKIDSDEAVSVSGARPAGTYGPDDPGDPGVGSTVHRCAFWVPVPEAERVPIKPTLTVIAKDDLAQPLGIDPATGRPFMDTIPNPWKSAVPDITADETAALQSGAYVEIIDNEAGGQISDALSQVEIDAALLAVWQRYADQAAG